jgi:hypothetical protein
VSVSCQECILNRILCIGCIAQLPIGASVEPRQVARQNVLHFADPIFANSEIHLRFTSDSLCRLHVPFLQVRQQKSTPPSNQARNDLPVCFQRDEST